MSGRFSYHVMDDFDHIFDEKGNSFLALRKIHWGDDIQEDKIKLDMRKWFTDADGNEKVGKGVSFLTDEGPNNLVKILLDNGYGHTVEVLDSIKDRDDFRSSLNKVLGEDDEHYDDTISEDLYDPTEETMFDY